MQTYKYRGWEKAEFWLSMQMLAYSTLLFNFMQENPGSARPFIFRKGFPVPWTVVKIWFYLAYQTIVGLSTRILFRLALNNSFFLN